MIKDLIIKGLQNQIDKAAEEESKKIGYLRAGNTGMVNPEGVIIGSCAAEAYLRMKGIVIGKTDINQELMFSSGRGNETLWVDSLKQVWNQPGQLILQEQETGTSWQTDTKKQVMVTGRPDIVLVQDDKPVMGIELKQVMSSYTASAVLFNNDPFLKHLMQMAHYMFALSVPFELWYTNRNKIDLPEYMRYNKNLPRPGTAGSEYLDFNFYRLGKINARSGKPTKHKLVNLAEYQHLLSRGEDVLAEPKKFRPFMVGYEGALKQNQLWIKRSDINNLASGTRWEKTIVNTDDIKRFYNYISEMELANKVPNKYSNLTYLGEELKFSFESPLEELSPEFWAGKRLDRWLAEVKRKFDIK